MKRADILQSLKKYKEEKGVIYGIQKIGVFGSVARETHSQRSDLDVVVTLHHQDLFSLIGIKQDLEEQFHFPVDLVSYRPRMNPFLKEKIDKEAVYV